MIIDIIPPSRKRYPIILNPSDSCCGSAIFAIQRQARLKVTITRPATIRGLNKRSCCCRSFAMWFQYVSLSFNSFLTISGLQADVKIISNSLQGILEQETNNSDWVTEILIQVLPVNLFLIDFFQ